MYSACNHFDNSQIIVINTDGTEPRNVTNNQGSNHSPEWSPNGDRIAYYSDAHNPRADEFYGAFDIYVMDSDGNNVVRLTESPGRDGGPVWSPNGERIAFYSNRDNDTEVYVMNSDGSAQERLTFHDGWDWPMGWSRASGRLLAYGMHGDNLDIYTMEPDGTDIRYLTDADTDEEHPAFAPDGKQIIYKVSDRNSSSLMVMNADGSDKTLIAESSEHIFDQPTFSADGKNIAYSVGNAGGEGVERFWRTVVIADRDGANPRILRSEIRP